MLSHMIRSLHRQTFKAFTNQQNYVKRFYTNQDFGQKNDDDYNRRQVRDFWVHDHWWDETSRVYQDYYKRYYDTKFGRSNQRQTDNDDSRGQRDRHNKRYRSNYTFNQCKFQLFTKRLIENIGYIGAAIVVGLHFEGPFYVRYRQKKLAEQLRCAYAQSPVAKPIQQKTEDDFDTSTICGDCKYCKAFISKVLVLGAPIREKYIFAKTEYLAPSQPKIKKYEEAVAQGSETDSNSRSEVLAIKQLSEEQSDPIDDICRQLENASIDYMDRLSNLLGIASIQTDPEEAMKLWSSAKSNPKALFNMGVAFERGAHSAEGKPDLKQAFRHYMLSASMGHKLAIYNLALFHLNGKGDVPIDYDRAEALLRRAAELGVDRANHYIEWVKRQRMARIKIQPMRTSSSAPNLMVWANRFENDESFNRYHNHSIANRV